MTKLEAKEFIEKMSEFGDEWTEDELNRSTYMAMTLQEATDRRLNELQTFATILTKATMV